MIQIRRTTAGKDEAARTRTTMVASIKLCPIKHKLFLDWRVMGNSMVINIAKP